MSYRYWIAVALLGSITGCAAPRPSQADAGAAPACSDQLPKKGVSRVYVDIDLSAGTPVASAPLCVVRSGTEVVWRTRKDELVAFELDFAESPGRAINLSRALRTMADTRFHSSRSGDRQQLAITTRQVTQETLISYDIRTSAGGVDPGIKIVPQ
ncbi:hypothetical protein [Stenotrophomonas sp. YIM B06876]|uniref:hypothetical protein n=1 Tax=Stenotrophomonas sp. YIM B06876 TaxID=3060211 RepID=UPI0027394BA6|nr:hypothetical protein [Stenotrophomonas sp. YIM B06876]